MTASENHASSASSNIISSYRVGFICALNLCLFVIVFLLLCSFKLVDGESESAFSSFLHAWNVNVCIG